MCKISPESERSPKKSAPLLYKMTLKTALFSEVLERKKEEIYCKKMGVKHFHKYCEMEVPNSHKTINILDELEKYKR